MIGAVDSYYTYEYFEHFKILPAINDWGISPERIKDGNKVPEGFVYSSDNNTEWMSHADLQACIEKKRVPCSLGYHFIMRNDELHIVYYLRSCDFVRHFRDDVYMTIRLLLWVLEQCRLTTQDHPWDNVKTGTLTMHMTSLHIFKADYPILFKEER